MGTDAEPATERLLLRRWRAGDREPFAALNADPEVAEYLAGPLTRAQSDELAERIEAGRVALAFGFERIGLEEIVSMTATGNARSRAVMERLGMSRDPGDDFDHPNVARGSPLRRHVLYRIARPGQVLRC